MIEQPITAAKRTLGQRTIRLDQPAGAPADEPVSPESPSWLERLRLAILADRKELRSSTRHRAVHREIWVAWWTNEEFGAVNGSLENISRGGALIVMNTRPPKNQPIWIYKELQGEMTCVRAKIAGVTPAPDGSFAARFRFEAPCPEALEKSAIAGSSAARKSPRATNGGDEFAY